MMKLIQHIGMIAAVAMPLWNIPLILTIQRRKSSKDLSALWAGGVFGCILLMLPAALVSPDRIFKAYSVMNTVFFGLVFAQVMRYR